MRDAMEAVLQPLAVFFLYALVAVFAQNAIFSRALGVSRLVKLVGDDAMDSVTYCLLLCAVQLVSAPLAYWVNLWLSLQNYRYALRPLVLVLCAAVGFVVVLLCVVLLMPASRAKKVAAVLPMATFNCSVLGAMLLTTTQNFTFIQTMGFALGSGLGYSLAVYLVTEGERKIQHERVPRSLQGLPIMLLYISILALAIYAFTGHMLVF